MGAAGAEPIPDDRLGFTIVEDRQPSILFEGSMLITGEVDRTTEFEQGMAIHQAWRKDGWQPDPLILDDQALVLELAGKGLVVLTGCGHSGIVKIVRYAKKLTGIDRLYAVIGGFHLTGGLFEPIIPQTIAALKAERPKL
jgi:7,8-dihydropterin-6-yl-methyl-4-(beta-D-ribofuranosyl)aminobenzene 5'-phosphate synthase